MTISVFLRSVLRTICLSATIITPFKFSWRRCSQNGYVLQNPFSCENCVLYYGSAGVIVQDDPVVDYSAPHLLWHKQHPGMCVENTNLRFLKDKNILNSALCLSLLHSCFIYVFLRLVLSVHHIYNYAHLFSAFLCPRFVRLHFSF